MANEVSTKIIRKIEKILLYRMNILKKSKNTQTRKNEHVPLMVFSSLWFCLTEALGECDCDWSSPLNSTTVSHYFIRFLSLKGGNTWKNHLVVYGKWRIYRKVKAVLGLHCWKRGIVKGKEKDVNFLLDFARRARNEVGEMEQKCKLWGFEVLFRALSFS